MAALPELRIKHPDDAQMDIWGDIDDNLLPGSVKAAMVQLACLASLYGDEVYQETIIAFRETHQRMMDNIYDKVVKPILERHAQ